MSIELYSIFPTLLAVYAELIRSRLFMCRIGKAVAPPRNWCCYHRRWERWWSWWCCQNRSYPEPHHPHCWQGTSPISRTFQTSRKINPHSHRGICGAFGLYYYYCGTVVIMYVIRKVCRAVWRRSYPLLLMFQAYERLCAISPPGRCFCIDTELSARQQALAIIKHLNIIVTKENIFSRCQVSVQSTSYQGSGCPGRVKPALGMVSPNQPRQQFVAKYHWNTIHLWPSPSSYIPVSYNWYTPFIYTRTKNPNLSIADL